MRIIKMKLENFKGLKTFEFTPNGENVAVYGDNGTGKTTLFDAFCWLLYGKPSTDEKNFTPQTTGTHNLDHAVEMQIETADGLKTLRKVFHEKYQTKRGSADKVFAGHTTEYELDGVPVQEKEYKKAMADLYDTEEIAKLLTRYNYFLEDMSIKERRNLLLDMCVDISPEELVNKVLNDNEDLQELPDILGGKEIEDYVKIAASQKKKIDAELKQIPARIDEAEKSKPESLTSSVGRAEIEASIEELKRAKKDIESKLEAADMTAESEIRKQIARVEAEKAEAYASYKVQNSAAIAEVNQQIGELENDKIRLLTSIKNLKESISERKAAHDRHTKRRETLLAEHKDTAGKEWTGDTICPTCGQPLPAEQIEEAKKKFHLKKSENLERIKEEGAKVSAEILETEEKEIIELENQVLAKQEGIEGIEAQIAVAKADYEEPSPFDGSEYDDRISELKEKLKDVESAANSVKADLRWQLEEVEKKIGEQQELLSGYAIIEQQDKRIAELEAREKELAAEFETLEKGLYLCEKFNRAKAEMLTNDINGHFQTLKFRLFQEQVDGGIADDCEALIECNGREVPFKSANNAARINAGLEVIDVLAAHYGFSLPIFIDGCESNCHPLKTKSQQIRLYVSEADKALRVETF